MAFLNNWTQNKGEELWTSLADLLFPPVCTVCGRGLLKSEHYLCTACLADFPFSDEAYKTDEAILLYFDESCRPQRLYSLYYYNKFSDYRNLIYLVKYYSNRKLAIYLGRMLGERMQGHCAGIDCIIPIPLHRKRERERGFNQALEIAKGISEVLHIEVFDDVVCRVRNNLSQTGKTPGERQKNVENIFKLQNGERIKGCHVLLLDDVITTGATIGSCLKILAEVDRTRFSLGCLAQTL